MVLSIRPPTEEADLPDPQITHQSPHNLDETHEVNLAAPFPPSHEFGPTQPARGVGRLRTHTDPHRTHTDGAA
eukprot:5018728-Prymnesium_polylepis.1